MKDKIEELRDMAMTLLATASTTENARNKWGENVRDLLQELSIYHFELEHQNAALAASELDLAESREKYVDLFEDAPIGYVIIDRNGVITQVNRTFTRLCVPPFPSDNAVTGRKFSDYIYPEYQASFTRFLEKLATSIHIISIEMKLIDFQGNPRFVTITAGRRKPGAPYFRLAINDITVRKKLEIKLLTAQKESEENNEKKQLFLTHIDHELQTMLSSIGELCESMNATPPPADTWQDYCATIKDTANRIKIVSDKIVTLALVDAESQKMRHAVVDVAKICDENVKFARNNLSSQAITIRCETDKLPRFFGDQQRIATIIHAILRHACATVTEGEICLCGNYESQTEGSEILRLEFIGNGISKKESHTTDDPSSNGSEIELFLAKQIVQFMNGALFCAPSGNVIQVELPLLKVPQAPSIVSKKEKSPTDESKTCLIVDDVLLNVKVLAALMQKLDYVPLMCTAGREALNILAENHVDIILTDLWMPEMNGMEFAKIVRQMQEYNDIPVIAVTADVERMDNFDMHYFSNTLIKPVKLETLKATIDSL